MTDRKQALIDLRDKVKAGDYTQIPPLTPFPEDLVGYYAKIVCAHCGSLDAAHALHKAMLPGWKVDINIKDTTLCVVSKMEDRRVNFSDSLNPARAWLLAILEALIAEADQ